MSERLSSPLDATDAADAACSIVNLLIPGYLGKISDPLKAIQEGAGNCFARMKLGGGGVNCAWASGALVPGLRDR